jgi:hypothetical protein
MVLEIVFLFAARERGLLPEYFHLSVSPDSNGFDVLWSYQIKAVL